MKMYTFIFLLLLNASVDAADRGDRLHEMVPVADVAGYYKMPSGRSLHEEGHLSGVAVAPMRQSFARLRSGSLSRSLSHPDRLNRLTEEIDATLGVSSLVTQDFSLQVQGAIVAGGEEGLEEGGSVTAVAGDSYADAIRLLARRTKEANDDRRAHEALIAQHLKQSRELAQKADARAEAADARAARARKMAILFAVGNGVATVGGWVWSSGVLHRWFGFDDGTDGGGD